MRWPQASSTRARGRAETRNAQVEGAVYTVVSVLPWLQRRDLHPPHLHSLDLCIPLIPRLAFSRGQRNAQTFTQASSVALALAAAVPSAGPPPIGTATGVIGWLMGTAVCVTG